MSDIWSRNSSIYRFQKGKTELRGKVNSKKKTVTSLKGLVAGFPLRRPRFEARSSHVESVGDRAALRQVFSKYFGFPCHSFIPLIAP
jgi:hypothetical protein